jgi:hypothetical protein
LISIFAVFILAKDDYTEEFPPISEKYFFKPEHKLLDKIISNVEVNAINKNWLVERNGNIIFIRKTIFGSTCEVETEIKDGFVIPKVARCRVSIYYRYIYQDVFDGGFIYQTVVKDLVKKYG